MRGVGLSIRPEFINDWSNIKKGFIEADICGEEGLIVAEGPSAKMIELTEKELTLWLEEYEAFLKSNKSLVKEKVAELE